MAYMKKVHKIFIYRVGNLGDIICAIEGVGNPDDGCGI